MEAGKRLEIGFLSSLEGRLEEILRDGDDRHPLLQAAMRHAILGGGKRLRPLMVRAAFELGSERDPGESLMLAACSVELLHGYSLIHDDLPAMDDDDFRRGRPSCHRQFGEAMAILAGDALQALAFESIAGAMEKSSLPQGEGLSLIRHFAIAAGPRRLVGGQAADLEPRAGLENESSLLWTHERKTAALFRLCLRLGGALGGMEKAALETLDEVGRLLGLAFQAMDDILDAISKKSELGKTPGKDRVLGRRTFVEVYGLARSREIAEEKLGEALSLLPRSKRAEPLRDLAERMVRRSR